MRRQILGAIAFTLCGLLGVNLASDPTVSEIGHESHAKGPLSLATIALGSGTTLDGDPVDLRLLAVLEADAWATELRVREAHQEELQRQAAEVARWEGLIRCEMGGDWHISGPVHSGLGFNNGTWLAFGGGEFASDAGKATPYQQVVIATRVRDSAGAGAWNSCGIYVPPRDGLDVRALQESLRVRGCDPGPIDGVYGPLTRAAEKRCESS